MRHVSPSPCTPRSPPLASTFCLLDVPRRCLALLQRLTSLRKLRRLSTLSDRARRPGFLMRSRLRIPPSSSAAQCCSTPRPRRTAHRPLRLHLRAGQMDRPAARLLLLGRHSLLPTSHCRRYTATYSLCTVIVRGLLLLLLLQVLQVLRRRQHQRPLHQHRCQRRRPPLPGL